MAGSTFMFCVYGIGEGGQKFWDPCADPWPTWSLEPLILVGGAGEARVFVIPQGQGSWDTQKEVGGVGF